MGLSRQDIDLIFAAQRKLLTAVPERPAARLTGPMTTTAYSRPLKSLALSCHPSQAAEFNEDLRKAGITGAHYDERGQFKAESRGGRRDAMKLRGAHDKDGGYGDG